MKISGFVRFRSIRLGIVSATKARRKAQPLAHPKSPAGRKIASASSTTKTASEPSARRMLPLHREQRGDGRDAGEQVPEAQVLVVGVLVVVEVHRRHDDYRHPQQLRQ